MNLVTYLNQAMTYIQEHIADALALDDASSVTAYPPYHFYDIADMPLLLYIRKRKLSLALWLFWKK